MSETYEYKFSGTGLTTSEKREGLRRFDSYRDIYPHLHKLSDLQLLEELVFFELIQERYKTKIAKWSKNKKVEESNAVSAPLQKQLNNNLEQIIGLKEKLGLFEQKKKLDAYQDFQSILGKHAKWREKNLGSRKVTCPFCSKIFFLMIRTDKYDAKKFPFFQDKILCNPIMHKWWKEGRITTEEYSEAMNTSSDFPNWLDENWFQKDPQFKPQVEDSNKDQEVDLPTD